MTEVRAKAQRRRFATAYKKKILAEVDACKERGEVGALLRREGLYSSHIAAWREAEARGELARAESKKRGPKPKVVDPSARRAEQLERRVAQLEKKLEQAVAKRRRQLTRLSKFMNTWSQNRCQAPYLLVSTTVARRCLNSLRQQMRNSKPFSMLSTWNANPLLTSRSTRVASAEPNKRSVCSKTGVQALVCRNSLLSCLNCAQPATMPGW